MDEAAIGKVSRKGAKHYRVKRDSSLRLGAFAGNTCSLPYATIIVPVPLSVNTSDRSALRLDPLMMCAL